MNDEPRRFRDTPGPPLIIAGILVALGGLGKQTLGCFTSMDRSCSDGALPLILIGIFVLAWGASFNRQR